VEDINTYAGGKRGLKKRAIRKSRSSKKVEDVEGGQD